MSRQAREIVKIDEDLCDGCGQCILSCAEGALQIIDGKARLVGENLCDGFGNCVGSCPQDAITIIKREADEFDEKVVQKHLETLKPDIPISSSSAQPSMPAGQRPHPASSFHKVSLADSSFAQIHSGGCPGSALRMFDTQAERVEDSHERVDEIHSTLSQWPVQLMLVPPTAPFLKGREILLAADCCPFAYADFHRRFLKGKALLVGCPKLDNLNHYRQKLEEIFRHSGCTGVTVMIMEVPCCGGLNIIARQALQASGTDIPYHEVIIGIRGRVLRKSTAA